MRPALPDLHKAMGEAWHIAPLPSSGRMADSEKTDGIPQRINVRVADDGT